MLLNASSSSSSSQPDPELEESVEDFEAEPDRISIRSLQDDQFDLDFS